MSADQTLVNHELGGFIGEVLWHLNQHKENLRRDGASAAELERFTASCLHGLELQFRTPAIKPDAEDIEWVQALREPPSTKKAMVKMARERKIVRLAQQPKRNLLSLLVSPVRPKQSA